jgi:hypothetical protein
MSSSRAWRDAAPLDLRAAARAGARVPKDSWLCVGAGAAAFFAAGFLAGARLAGALLLLVGSVSKGRSGEGGETHPRSADAREVVAAGVARESSSSSSSSVSPRKTGSALPLAGAFLAGALAGAFAFVARPFLTGLALRESEKEEPEKPSSESSIESSLSTFALRARPRF